MGMGFMPGAFGQPVDPRLAGRQCLAIPDGSLVVSVVFFAMVFTYFVIPLGIPNASLFKNGIPSDGYSVGSTIFHWFALLIALTLYYPRAYRTRLPPTQRVGAPPSPCAAEFLDDEIGNSVHPITTVLITYAVVKAFSFVASLAAKNSAVETQRLLRTVLALAELIVIYMFVYNMSENARQKVIDQRALLRPQQGGMGMMGGGYAPQMYNQSQGYYNQQDMAEMAYMQQHQHQPQW